MRRLRAQRARPSQSEPGEKVPRGSAAWKRGTEFPSAITQQILISQRLRKGDIETKW